MKNKVLKRLQLCRNDGNGDRAITKTLARKGKFELWGVLIGCHPLLHQGLYSTYTGSSRLVIGGFTTIQQTLGGINGRQWWKRLKSNGTSALGFPKSSALTVGSGTGGAGIWMIFAKQTQQRST